MKKLKNVITLIFLSMSLNSLAGHETGNGGDVVICYGSDKSVESVEILDFYEGRLRGYSQNLGDNSLTVLEKVYLVLNRLNIVDPIFNNILNETASTFMSNTALLKNINLTDVPDSKEVFLEKGCQIEQVAINHSI